MDFGPWGLIFADEGPAMFRLWFYNDLAFHSAVADAATIAAVERIGSWCARHKFHYSRKPLFELKAVIIVRTENEARIVLLVRAIRAEIDLETVRLVERGDSQLDFESAFYTYRRRSVFVLLCGHLNDLYVLVGLRSIRQSGEIGGDGKSTQQEQRRNSKYARQFYSSRKMEPGQNIELLVA